MGMFDGRTKFGKAWNALIAFSPLIAIYLLIEYGLGRETFLDFIDCDAARTVLFRARSRLQQRLSNFRQRSEKCPHTGRFTNLWLTIETDRLENSLKSLNLICQEIDDELQLTKYGSNHLYD